VADTKISSLTALTGANVDTAADLLAIVDTSVTTTKKILIDELRIAVGGFTTGDVKLTLKTTADSGWVMCNDGTIGNGASGGTTRANADTVTLFTLLWNNVADAQAAVSTGRGANAAADYAANKTIALTKMLGRAFGASGAGSGLTSRVLGLAYGVETHALSVAELATHRHNINGSAYSSGVAGISGATTGEVNTGTGNTDDAGSGTAHQNMQPTAFVNAMIKL